MQYSKATNGVPGIGHFLLRKHATSSRGGAIYSRDWRAVSSSFMQPLHSVLISDNTNGEITVSPLRVSPLRIQ